jgi:hypothetical protein
VAAQPFRSKVDIHLREKLSWINCAPASGNLLQTAAKSLMAQADRYACGEWPIERDKQAHPVQ